MAQVGVVVKMQSALIYQVVLTVNAHQDLLETQPFNVKILMNVIYQTLVGLELYVKTLLVHTLVLVLKERYLIQIHVLNVMRLLHAKEILIVQEMPFVTEKNVVFVQNLILEMIADVSLVTLKYSPLNNAASFQILAKAHFVVQINNVCW